MTEQQWLTCSKATLPVLDWLHRQGTERKFYLAGAAAVRHVWDQLPHQLFRDLIAIVERYADRQASREELSRAYRKADQDSVKRYFALPDQGRRLTPATRRAAAARAATFAAMPGGGWEAGTSALVEVLRTGKRADIWPWQCAMLRDLFGNPFRPVAIHPAWSTSTVTSLAQGIYDDRAFDRMPILADALEDAGCTSTEILEHCRSGNEHVRGCWVVDLVLGKE
ncbi:hypothetical protein AYO44_03545 [Planctomycetaceae bacterium SCGC AG-212-F19]|nr:hypothetical protein AYO44_03545 [Planctomycetaceae bacterium SCGC AG-212-F19]